MTRTTFLDRLRYEGFVNRRLCSSVGLDGGMAFGGGGNHIVKNSVYGDGSTGYFSRTNGAAPTDAKKVTIVAYVKRTSFAASNSDSLISADGAQDAWVAFKGGSSPQDVLYVEDNNLEATRSTQVFRDGSAFGQLILAYDTTQAVANDRLKVYWEGSQITGLTISNITQNDPVGFTDNGTVIYIGRAQTAVHYFTSYIANFYLIDGQALTPSSFGETDAITGSWKPKRYAGTYGTNGFHLQFENGVNLGLDTQNSNTGINDAATVFGSHFDGVDASTAFTDVRGRTITANGNAQLDTADFKFGTASLLLDGTGDYASVAGTVDFNLNGDFTIEGFAKTSAATNANEVILTLSTVADGDGPAIILYSRHSSVANSGPRLRTTTGAGGAGLNNIDHGTSMVGAGWWHWAVTRTGTTLRFFINGTLIGSATPSWPTFASPSLVIGAQGSTGGNNFTGWIDDVRILNGVCLYTVNFTPPSAAFSYIHNNSFTKNGTVTQTTDSPTDDATNNIGNYCTLDPLDMGSSVTLSNGNRNYARSGDNAVARSTIWLSGTENIYLEVKCTGSAGASTGFIGLCNSSKALTTNELGQIGDSNSWVYTSNGTKSNNGTSAYGASWTTNDVIGVHYNAGALTFYKNNVSQGQAFSGISGLVALALCANANGWTFETNFGAVAFVYSPPSGAKRLCTANLAATTGTTSGSFTGNANADGPRAQTGAPPATLTIDGSAVTWGTHADKLANGFKIRTASSPYNDAATNNWTATYDTPQKPFVGSNRVQGKARIN